MKKLLAEIVCAVTVITFAGLGMCAEAAKPKPVKPEKTKEEMVTDIKNKLKDMNEIVGSIPSLKAEKDQAGNISYTFKGVELDKMNKPDLQKLYTSVRQMATKIRTERIQRQLESIKRAQQLNVQATGARAIPAVPQPPPAQPRVVNVSTPPAPPPTKK